MEIKKIDPAQIRIRNSEPGATNTEDENILSAPPSEVLRKPVYIPRPNTLDTADDYTANLRADPADVLKAIFRDEHLFLNGNGIAHMVNQEADNAVAINLTRNQLRKLVRFHAGRTKKRLSSNDINELSEILLNYTESNGQTHHTWYRVAEIEGGIEIDIGNAEHARIRILPGKVTIITVGSHTLFYRTPTMRPLVMPAADGDINLLKPYVNLHPADYVLLLAWITFTLAHPKIPTTNYLFLVLLGKQGSGKSTLCKIVQRLVDPANISVQTFPNKPTDLVIAAQNSHVLFYDNMREIKQFMSDVLCIAATGGSLTNRKLYSDAELNALYLHVAMVLNSIHPIVDQPDLADRCLQLELTTMDENHRVSEAELMRKFEADLPAIFKGILDLISKILPEIPTAVITDPERMIAFVRWLAAMESVDGAPVGAYQGLYSARLSDSMAEGLYDNPLAEAVISLSSKHRPMWKGTPSELLAELNDAVGRKVQYTRDWPSNASSLTKQLMQLQAPLNRQGIDVQRSRGKCRIITITNTGDFSNDNQSE